MEKIKIITDSTSDLPVDILKRYDIEVLPLLVNIDGHNYRDGIDINLPELLEKMEHSKEFPTTAQVNPQRFIECYKEYLDNGYKVLSIHISSNMSGTYQSACIAKEMLKSDDITIIDSLNVTSGLGLLVLKAAKLKEDGFGIKEIESSIIETIPHVRSVLAFDTLENLVKGGRLSRTAGIIGNILDIKLIIEIKDGKLAVMDKVRGSRKAVRYILEYLSKRGSKENEDTILLSVKSKDIVEILREELKLSINDFIECEVGCVVGVHAGPGACGIFFVENY